MSDFEKLEQSKDRKTENTENVAVFDVEACLGKPKPKYQQLTEYASRFYHERKENLSSGLRMALMISHSERWLPFLYRREDRMKQSMGMSIILNKYSFHEYSEDLEHYFSEKLKDQIIVNLACGNESALVNTFKRFSPRGIVNVDISKPAGIKTDARHRVVVGEDVLEFVSRLPDDFCSFTVSGLDSNVLPSKEYHEALLQEVHRSLKKEGILFGNQSDILNYARSLPDLRKVEIKNVSDGDLEIFEKANSI